AAEELNVAQPSVSQQIRKLENELGTPLFHRMKRHVALTEAGTLFLPRALAAFSRRHPGIALEFREAGSRTLLQLLEEGELDLAVVIQPIRHPALETLPLVEEELLLAVPRAHALAGGSRRVPMAQLRDEPYVMLREGA